MIAASPPALVQASPATSGARLVAAARQLMAVSRDNRYAYTPEIDPRRGVFHADCSDLIDYLAVQVRPEAIAPLPRDPGHPAPRAWNFYSYFAAQPLVGARATGPWEQVRLPQELLPGDVIAWKNARYIPHQSSTGHVMLVEGPPRAVVERGAIAGYEVPVIDATAHGHGAGDPRTHGHSGIGHGTIYLAVAASGLASGFSWTPAHPAGTLREPSLAFGRLLEPLPQARL